MNGGDNTNFDGGNSSDAPNNGRQRHGIVGSRRYRGPSEEQNYSAATNLANNPNTPEFFSEAVMANTAAPQPRKSHKKLIIGAIIGIAVIVIIIIATATVSNNIASKPYSNSFISTFNKFANYVIDGKEEETPIGLTAYDYDRNYSALGRMKYSDDDDKTEMKQYISHLLELNKSFMDSYNSLNSEKISDEFSENIQIINNICAFLKDYAEYEDPSVQTLANINGWGESRAKSWVDNYYDRFNKVENPYSNRYGAIKTEILRIEAELSLNTNFFQVCLLDQKQKDCENALSKIDDKKKQELLEGDQYVKDADSMVRDDVKELISYTIATSNLINGQGDNK